MISLTLDQLARAIFERGGNLVLRDGRLLYTGPRLAPDDPLAAVIAAHRL